MELIYIPSTSSTRCPMILNIKACAICSQPWRLAFKKKKKNKKKTYRSPADPSLMLSDMSTCHLGDLLSVVPRLERPGLSDTSRLTLWLTGVVKTDAVTSNTWQHISQCVCGSNLCQWAEAQKPTRTRYLHVLMTSSDLLLIWNFLFMAVFSSSYTSFMQTKGSDLFGY